jgi:nucleoside-diphosphate kinase
MSERTLVMIKPDAVRRGLIGEVLSRYERKGLSIVALEYRRADDDILDRHYAEHLEKDFYPALKAFMAEGNLMVMILAGESAISVVRGLNGTTDGRLAAAGSIRGDLALSVRENLVHGSDSVEAAEREISLWFPGG